MLNQAKMYIDKREYQKAENCYLNARKPEEAIKMYTDLQNYNEAIRLAKKVLP